METVLPRRRKSQGSIRSPLIKRDNQSQVVIEGWLHKLEGSALKQWKHRWCVLADFCLFSYKGPGEEKVSSSVLLPSYKIGPCTNQDKISRKFAFKAEHQNMKTYYFAAENKEYMKRWMNAMSLASIMQKFSRCEIPEVGLLSSTSNDDEDSGFTSFRSRRYGSHDPNSTLDGSYNSEPLHQRSSSYGDRVGEMYLSSDDKYPNAYKNHRPHPYKALSVEQSSPARQPLYANAPPKPRRLTQSDPFAISPSEQYDNIGHENLAPNYSQRHHQESDELPGDNYPRTRRISTKVFEERTSPIHDDDFHQSSDNGNMQYKSDVTSEHKVFEQPPRPHSADFLERDEEFRPAIRKKTTERSQPQRPKSSLECYDRYWEADECGFYDYREAVRTQADHFYTNKSFRHNQVPYNKRERDVHSSSDLRPSSQSTVEKSLISSTRKTDNRSELFDNDDYSYGTNYHDPTSASAKHHSHSSGETIPRIVHSKKKTHEESMRRLIEWKQRMLQSPLTKRSVQHSPPPDTNSSQRAPVRPPLPNEYRLQVLQELENHEARLRIRHLSNDRNILGQDVNDHSSHADFFCELNSQSLTSNSMHNDTGKYEANICSPETSIGQNSHFINDKKEREHCLEDKKFNGCDLSGGENKKVMYCVDAENNEILISYEAGDVPVETMHTPDSGFYICKEQQVESVATTSNKNQTVGSYNQQEKTSDQIGTIKDVRKTCNQKTVPPRLQRNNLSSRGSSRGFSKSVCYSSDDEASNDSECRNKRTISRNKSPLFRSENNVSDSEIQVKGSSHLKKLVKQSECLTSKGKRLSISAGDLLGKTHEELVLLLIQLRRNQSRISRAKEKCQEQLENEENLFKVGKNGQQGYSQNVTELARQILQLEKQYEVTQPIVNLVDNMVKLGSLYGSSDKRSSSFLHLDMTSASEKALPTNTIDELPTWSTLLKEEKDLQGHLNEIYHLDRGLRQETHSFSSLQQDKEMLEHTLLGMKNKILDHQDKPIELQRLRKQQKMIEKELSRVKRLLSHSAKKIEEATAKNDQLEQEILQLRQKIQQALKSGACEMETCLQSRADLEAELTRVQNVLEELANHRQEISNTVEKLRNEARSKISSFSPEVRASPTGVAGSAPLPLRKKQQSAYLETDLDTMETRDLALSGVCRDLDDIPVYVNAEEINSANQEKSPDDQDHSVILPQCGDSTQYLLQDISDADDRMKRFYGILPREKTSEIKTVRIVKRQSERRSRERDKKRVTYDDQSLVWVMEEPDVSMSSDEHLEIEEDDLNRTKSLSSNDHRPTSIPLPYENSFKIAGSQSAHERLFGRGRIREEENVLFKRSSEHSPEKRWKRRHYTVSGYQCMLDPQLSQFSQDKPRSRDDVDMERCLRTANTPDIVRSTIKKKEVFDERIIERELGLPQKIVIPERYIEEEPEHLSAREKLKRSLKAENIRKMLSETTTFDDLSEEKRGPPGALRKKLSEEKRKRAHLLALNHTIAQEVMERSKVVAVLATINYLNSKDNEMSSVADDDLSPMVPLPITQQRYNFLC